MRQDKNSLTEEQYQIFVSENQKQMIFNKLRESGCRITRQRKVLIDIILNGDCGSCKEIYYLAVKKDPEIGMATIYRMMNTLEEIGVLQWKNSCKISCKPERLESGILIKYQDSQVMRLENEKLFEVLEKGLEACGYNKDIKISSVSSLEKKLSY